MTNYSKLTKAHFITKILGAKANETNILQPSLTTTTGTSDNEAAGSHQIVGRAITIQGYQGHPIQSLREQSNAFPSLEPASIKQSAFNISMKEHSCRSPSKLDTYELSKQKTQNKQPRYVRQCVHPTSATPSPIKGRFRAPRVISASTSKPAIGPSTTSGSYSVLKIETLSTEPARSLFIKGSFLEGLYATNSSRRQGHANRRDGTKKMAHISFQGLDSKLYTTSSTQIFAVGLRFWLSRLHTVMLAGLGTFYGNDGSSHSLLGANLLQWPRVTNCEKLTDDIYLVETCQDPTEMSDHSSSEAFIVLYANGDVLGRSSTSTGVNGHYCHYRGCLIRQDWSRYIQKQDLRKISSFVHTKNLEDFPGGVSRVWTKAQTHGNGQALLDIAQRTVFSSCAPER